MQECCRDESQIVQQVEIEVFCFQVMRERPCVTFGLYMV